MKQLVIFYFAFFSIAIPANANKGIMQNKKALLIAIGEYPKGGEWSNISCTNDIPYLKKGLYKFGFTDKSIAVISDAFASKQNILNSMDSLVKQTNKGDIVMVHYSGHAYKMKTNFAGSPFSSLTYLIPYAKADCVYPERDNCWKEFINTEEFSIKLNLLRAKAGNTGQVVFTSDASYMGPDAVESIQANPSSPKTRGGFFDDFSNIKSASNNDLSPFIFMSGCLGNQYNVETSDTTGKAVGLFSFAFFKAASSINNSARATYLDLHNLIKKEISNRMPKQLAAVAGDFNQLLFSNHTNYMPPVVVQPSQKIKIKGNCYIISIGIDKYKRPIDYIETKNSVSDAKKMGQFINQQFASLKTDSSSIIYYELSDSKATKPAIPAISMLRSNE